MRADPAAGLPGRTPLYDASGRLLLVFTPALGSRDERPWADGAWRPPAAPVGETCRAILTTLHGYALSTSDPELVTALRLAGAAELRHAHALTHTLRGVPDLEAQACSSISVEPLSAIQLERLADRLGELHVAAYPAGHPDHAHSSVQSAAEELRAIANGDLLGPYLPESRVALVGGDIAGACLVVDREGAPPAGGPWIIDVFRDPECPVRGVGTALLVGVLSAAVAAGFPAVSLAVSDANVAARRRYAALGFVDAGESWTLAVP